MTDIKTKQNKEAKNIQEESKTTESDRNKEKQTVFCISRACGNYT